MVNFKRIILTALVLASIASIVVIVILVRSGKPKTTGSLPPSGGAKYGSLQPGVSTLAEITKQLGTTEKETASGSATILDYKSNNPNFNNEITVQSGKLAFVKQVVTMGENITVKDLNQKYGIYENVLYGPLSSNGFHLYVYPDKGIAYIANQGAEIVLEIWYFAPTTLDNFKTLYAPDYSPTYSPRGQ